MHGDSVLVSGDFHVGVNDEVLEPVRVAVIATLGSH
jgi:hypothetical protein